MNHSSLFRQAVRIVFRYGEKSKLNLFEVFPGLKRFFENRRNIAFVRTFSDITFTIIIILGLFGPQDPEKNVSLFIAWGLWWTSVVLSWFFVGKLWCGVCPFPGLGRIFQGLGLSLNRNVPEFFKKNYIYFSTGLLAIIIWTEAVTDMRYSPAGTSYLLLSILLGATVMEVLFKGQAWCRICPMGTMIGTAATMAMTEFRPDHARCRTCKTFSCAKGKEGISGCPVYLGAFNVRNSISCLVCGRCVGLCDHDSPRINLRNPFTELIINKGRYITCSRIILFLMGTQMARFAQHKPWYFWIETSLGSKVITFTLFLVAGVAISWAVTRLGAHLFTVTEDEVFGKFSPMVPVVVPLAFAGELAYRLDYFLYNVGDFLPTVGRQFGFDLGYLGFSIPEEVVYRICQLCLALGAVAGSYILHVFHHEDLEGVIPRKNYFALHLLVLALFATYLALF